MLRRAVLITLFLFVSSELLADSNSKKLENLKSMTRESQGAPAWIEEKKETEEEPSVTAGKMFQGLALCMGLFFVVVAILKRAKGAGYIQAEQRLEVIERIALTQKTSLVLTKLDHREILLAVGGEQVQLIQKSTYPGSQSPEQLTEQFDAELQFSMDEKCQKDIPLSA